MSQALIDPAAVSGYVNRRPTFINRLSSIVRTLRVQGVTASLTHYSGRFVQIVTLQRPPESAPDPIAAEGCFAQEDFAAPLSDLAIQSPNAKWGLPYVPTHQDVFQQAMRSLPIRFGDYDFVDLGAGKGFALLLAAAYGFHRVTGIEYSKVFADNAASNIADFKPGQGDSRHVNCLWGDASDFEFSDTPTVLYLFNPFQGKVMDQVIDNMNASLRRHPRDFWVVYGIPWEDRKFRRNPLLKLIESKQEYSIYRYAMR